MGEVVLLVSYADLIMVVIAVNLGSLPTDFSACHDDNDPVIIISLKLLEGVKGIIGRLPFWHTLLSPLLHLNYIFLVLSQSLSRPSLSM